MGLAQIYETCLRELGRASAQVLLTHADLSDRERYLNARSTLLTLLQHRVLPVINENDTVVNDEIKFGDNDTLGALVTNLIEADVLVILTDQQGLYSADPRKDPEARLIAQGQAGDPALTRMAGGAGSALGRGGMLTKVLAGERAARSGAATVIAYGREPDVLLRLAAGESIGTALSAALPKRAARKQWMADHLQLRGGVRIDAGAARALRDEGRSLLPVGVREVSGEFHRGDVIAILGPDGSECARGLANYAAAEARLLAGRTSAEIEPLLGYVAEPELVHRDNLVLSVSPDPAQALA
jgi:glutamate 5-kinase